MNRTRPPNRTFTTIPKGPPAPPWQPDPLPTPPSLDQNPHSPQARDQGSHGGMCVSFATCAAVSTLRHLLGFPDLGLLSPLYLNYVAGNAERQKRPGKAWADGVAVESAFAACVSHGVPSEAWWPYDVGRAHEPPSWTANLAASRNRITGFASLSDSQRNPVGDRYGPARSHYDLDLLRRAVQQRAGFVVNFIVTGEELRLDAGGFLQPDPGTPDPREKAHCVFVNGYSDSEEAFVFVNSYSASWGWTEPDGRVHGRGRVRYRDLVRPDLCYSLTVVGGISGRRG